MSDSKALEEGRFGSGCFITLTGGTIRLQNEDVYDLYSSWKRYGAIKNWGGD
jgi:hypothetical protein